MTPGLPKEIADFMQRYGVLADEIWSVRSGAYAIKHKAIERVAAAEHVEIERLNVFHYNPIEKTAAVIVSAKLKDRYVTTTGEAAPGNNKNAYPLAMAEKRAVDRAVLKLLNTHGALFSESEADEFGDPGNGNKGTLLKSSQYARSEYQKLLTAIHNCTTRDMLDQFSDAYKEQIRAQPDEWKTELRREWAERAEELST